MPIVVTIILKVVNELQRTTVLDSSSGFESIIWVHIAVEILFIAITQMRQDGEMSGLSLSLSSFSHGRVNGRLAR